MKYFVQEIARNYLRNLPDGTEEFNVHQKHLHGLSEEEFKDGYSALILFMRGLYADIIKDPASFYMMTPQLVESETPKIKFGIEYLYRCLNDENREIAKTLHDFVEGKNHKTKTLFSGFMRNIWTCSYTGIKTKKTVMSLKTQQDRLRVKLNLENIHEYMDVIMQMPKYIREIIRSNGDPCNRSHQCFAKCAGGFAFEMGGVAYKTCRVSAFWFNNMAAQDVPYIKKLLEFNMP